MNLLNPPGGKGHTQRSADQQKFGDNFDAIFRKKAEPKTEPETAEGTVPTPSPDTQN